MAPTPSGDRLPALVELRRAFRDVRSAHVASMLPDGSPHVVPLWFVWLEEGIVVSCRRGSQVWRNLLRDPRVALDLDRGRAWSELAGVLVRGTAEPVEPDEQLGKRSLSAWFDKYREELAGAGFAAYAEQVLHPRMFRVVALSWSVWAHGRTTSR